MPVPVRVYSENKTDSADFRLVHTQNNQEFIVDPGFSVSEVKIDPDYWLISETEVILQAPVVEKASDVVIFPNPFSDKIYFAIPGNDEIKKVRLFSNSGKLIQENIGEVDFYPFTNLPKGIYIIEITTSKSVFLQKIVKSNS